MTISVLNEFDLLRRVLVFRPGPEVESCFPGPLSLDQIHVGKWYWPLRSVQEEFDSLVSLIKGAGSEVFEVRQLLTEVIQANPGKVLQEVLGNKFGSYLDYYQGKLLEPKSITEDLIVGLPGHFSEKRKIIGPLQYATWVRDWGTVVGSSVFLWPVIERRRPAAAILRVIVRYHPIFAGVQIFDYVENSSLTIEGGDVLILGEDTVAIGIGPRTTKESAAFVAQTLVNNKIVRQVYLVEMPRLFEVLHLDQVLAVIGPQTALCAPYIFDKPEPYQSLAKEVGDWILAESSKTENELPFGLGSHKLYVLDDKGIREGKPFLQQLCEDGLVTEVVWVGGQADMYSSPIEHFRVALVETARQAANVLTTAPWRVLAYADASPKTQTNLWQKAVAKGGNCETFNGPWLIQGKGGPHCLTMPLERG